jgi:DNA-binding NarL/FixJ family response regulator
MLAPEVFATVTVRVLIVDDQAPFRLAARLVVEATDGFEVVAEVETGEDAVTAAAELRPDLVLMDVNLPGIDGLEATRLIREESAGGVTVLLLSTYEAEDYAGRAVECGAAGFIPKSQFGPERLSETWESVAAA